jgi:acyl-CoA thioester hydrolase
MSAAASERSASFAIEARVYYEDTDAAGVVYYANYLRFFERCRTEWLRAIGHDQSVLARNDGIAFVVRRVAVDYRKPARLDNRLRIELAASMEGRTRIRCRQRALRIGDAEDGGELLVDASVELACIDAAQFRPVPVPGWLADLLPRTESR